MEHGLRRYEAAQRLMWFVFFIVCLVIAYPVSKLLKGGHPKPASSLLSFPPDALKSASFWTQLQWMQLEPFGSVAAYLVCVAILFLAGRFAWLIVQFVGKHLVMGLLTESIGQVSGRPAAHLDGSKVNLERLFPSQLLLVRMDRIPLQRVFHACQRLRLMLSNPDRPLSSEGLIEKERRIVETDWQILWSSWTPFRWLVWSLPVVALVQSGWLLFQRLQPALSGQRELLDVLGPMVGSLLPLVQTVAISVFLGLISGLVRRIENFYLSNIDSLFYDKLLSRLPFQSSDTLILLEVMQRQFQELHAALKRVEASVAISRSSVGRR